MAPQSHILHQILAAISHYGTTPSAFITTLLDSPNEDQYTQRAMNDIGNEIEVVLEHLFSHDQLRERARQWACKHTTKLYESQVIALTRRETGLHFTAKNTTEQKLKEFDIHLLAQKMQNLAPDLWELMGGLLAADSTINRKRERRQRKKPAKLVEPVQRDDGDIDMRDVGDSDEDYWEGVDDIAGLGDEDDEPEDKEEQVHERFLGLVTIKKIVCVSILLQSTNQRCNALQSILGVFLHSCNTPETVRELLAHAGLSISTSTINDAVTSLSAEAVVEMRRLGRTFLTSYAFDNLDIDLKHSVPTAEKPQDTLIHITSGTMLPLHHGITKADLDCSDKLWQCSINNRKAERENLPTIDILDLLHIHPEQADPTGFLRRDRFISWKFRSDLVNFGPEYFRKFRNMLGDPEMIEAIPVVKTTQIPNRALDVSPSTAAQNAEAITAFMKQGGVGDTTQDAKLHDPRNLAILVFGDLLTGERIRSLLDSRSEEETPLRRMQFVVYVMGLFHFKMACADAVWRVFIRPKKGRDDSNSLMEHVSKIRPKETGKIETKPGFRRMHEVIQHTGIVSRLDCWRLEAAKTPGIDSLEDFANTSPDWSEVEAMANRLCVEQVANNKTKPRMSRETQDQQRDNTLLRQQYFLLYEEISHAMNAGDIGRLETCFMPWSFIFQGCGKHKYASELKRYLENVHFNYPKGLAKAVRMNILCNPTGKKGKFRAIDWLVEHNNLYTKRIFGGKYSNHQKSRILKESPLIETFKNVRIQFEKMFCLEHKTSRHSPPKMEKTFLALATYMRKEKCNEYVAGRQSQYSVPDAMAQGMHVMMMDKNITMAVVDTEWEDLPDDFEVDDDGDLDV